MADKSNSSETEATISSWPDPSTNITHDKHDITNTHQQRVKKKTNKDQNTNLEPKIEGKGLSRWLCILDSGEPANKLEPEYSKNPKDVDIDIKQPSATAPIFWTNLIT